MSPHARRPLLFAALGLLSCAHGLGEVSCPEGRTALDGVCVRDEVADYVACVRAQGASLDQSRAQKLSADLSYAGAKAGAATEVEEQLAKQYAASDANVLEIIRACNDFKTKPEVPSGPAVGQATGCMGLGAKLVGCGFETEPTWADGCEKAPAYKSCLENAAGDCDAMAVCGYTHFGAQKCGGSGTPAGKAGCADTTACQSKCSDDACICACNAQLSPAAALETAIQNQCSTLHCAACGTQGKPSCAECFSSACGSKYAQMCNGK